MANAANHLTEEELSYLRELFQERSPIQEPPALPIKLEPQGLDRERLLRMLAEMQAELVASDGDLVLRFRLELDPASDGAVKVAAPNVIDRRGEGRSARVAPRADEVRIVDRDGLLEEIRVVDVSDTGLQVHAVVKPTVEPGCRLSNLQIVLPGHGPVDIVGTVVRTTPAATPQTKLVAIELNSLTPEAQAALRAYVFSRFSRE